MKSTLRLLLLPFQAPMLLLLIAVSTYLGMHWILPMQDPQGQLHVMAHLVWSAEMLQALVVVVVCTMPDLLLRQVSTMMSSSRVISLVVTLLLVTILGLYLLHGSVLAVVLILASSVLLARLDLVRIRVVPPPLVLALALSLVVLAGASAGLMIAGHLAQRAYPLGEPPAVARPER